jgi:hypothetical protein
MRHWLMLSDIPGKRRITVGGDNGYPNAPVMVVRLFRYTAIIRTLPVTSPAGE